MTDSATRLDRLRALYQELTAHDPSPGDAGNDGQWDVWMERIGADADLPGLVSQAMHGGRLDPGEVSRCRAAAERLGSCLDADPLVDAYRLLGER